jgi:selT/selW/selH-like putative selenoprotein
MARNYHTIKEFILTHFEGVDSISGGNYPPPFYAEILATLFGYIFILGIVFIGFGDNIFESLGIQQPEFLNVIKNNKMMAVVGLFYLNSLGTSLLATGAFEIALNGEVVFSKLELKRFPSVDELIQMFATKGIKYMK